MAACLARSVSYALLALLTTAASIICGCATTSDNGLAVVEGDAARAMPETVTAYGFHYVRGRLLDPAWLRPNERHSLMNAQRAGIFAVQGIRYRTVVKGSDKDRTVSSSVAFGGELVNTQIKARDSLAVPGATGHWVVTTIEVPFVYNAGDALEQAVRKNVGYRVEVPVDRGSTLGPRFVALRALEAVLKHKHGGKAGTYTGTAFVLRCEPRVERREVADRNPDQRWTTGQGPSMEIPGDPEKKLLVFDVEIVVAEDFRTAALEDATLQPLDEVLPD